MVDRWNLLHPSQPQKIPYVTQILSHEEGVFVAASDYMKALPDGIAKWIPQKLISLGTDGVGRSESREALRDFFEVDSRHIVFATLVSLCRNDKMTADVLQAVRFAY